MKKILIIILLYSNAIKAQDIQRQQVIMGTFSSITLEKKYNNEIQKGFKLLKSIEKSLSSYNKTALLYKLNQNKKVKADTYLLQAIQKSQKYHKLTNGYFNIAIGSITRELYHFGEEETVPNKEAVAYAKTNINSIKIEDHIISIDKDTTLDLGGMGKGYGVDKVANYYREKNISHGIIALSGDIQALHPTSIYIDSPFLDKPFAKLQTLQANTSISTSGTYRRYVQSQEHHHLINPKSKKQGRSFVSITLITKQNNSLIDAMATAIGVMPSEEALNFLEQHPSIGFILLRPNGNVLYGNLEGLVKLIWL